MTKVYFCLFLVLILCFVQRSWSQCSIQSRLDFGTNSPLLITGSNFVYPSRNTPGILSFAANQVQNGFCPATTVSVLGMNTSADAIALACNGGTRFRAPTNVHEFSNIRCNRNPASTTRQPGGSCPRGVIVEIGFQITANTFVRQIDLCFNSNVGETAWAHAIIPGAIVGRQTAGAAPAWRVANWFPNIPVANAYTRNAQVSQFTLLLDLNQTLVNQYIPGDSSNFLARGHLVARADNYYTAQQYSSFYYVNAAPMWQSINNGNWRTVEDVVRTIATANGDLEVWSGGLFTLQLASDGGRMQDIYLAQNSQRNQPAMRVPKLLFKVAYHRPSNRAVVFITANNPFLASANLPRDYRICTNYVPCQNLISNSQNVNRGVTYCCQYGDFVSQQFVRTIGLPNLANVRPLV